MDYDNQSLSLDFSKEVIYEFKNMLIVIRLHRKLTKNDLNEILLKACVLKLAHKEKKVSVLNIVVESQLDIEEKLVSKYSLREENGGLLTDDFEIIITSINEAKKEPKNDLLSRYLRFLDADTLEDLEKLAGNDPILKKAFEKLKEFYQSKKYQDIAKKINKEEL